MASAASAPGGQGQLPLHVVVMGVSGCGKTTLGQALASHLGLHFVEGDALHPPANVARMAAGIALTDADRQGWLAAVAGRLATAAAMGEGLVVSCSALKRAYRDRLRDAVPSLRLVFLQGDPALIAARLAARQGHYMPPSLLPSQIATLEPPGADESPIALDLGQPLDVLVQAAVQCLGQAQAGRLPTR